MTQKKYFTPEALAQAKRDWSAKYRASHHKQSNAWSRRCTTNKRRLTFGLTETQYWHLAIEQQGKCAICGDKVKLVADHNHETNTARGLVCRLCNTGLGHFRDDPNLLIAAAQYLDTHRE